MIQEKKDLVDRTELCRLVVQRMNRHCGSTLNALIDLRDFLEILGSLPTQEELGAEWIKNKNGWVCSWCLVPPISGYASSYCPHCGRRMKLEGR